jgi:transketolase C-terminal domain/subunit
MIFFKRRKLRKTESNMAVDEPVALEDALKSLVKTHKNVALVEVGPSARNAFAQAVGFAVAGKTPVVVGPADMMENGADVLRDNIVRANMNVKFVVSAGKVDEFLGGDLFKPQTTAELLSDLQKMVTRFGPCCVQAEKSVY